MEQYYKNNKNTVELKFDNLKCIQVLDEKRQAFKGIFALLLFLGLWIVSCGYPAILFFQLYNGWYIFSFFTTILYFIGYLSIIPTVPFLREQFASLYSRYFKQVTLTFEEGCDLFKNDKNEKKQKTMSAIHPHGIFCLSWTVLFSRPEFENTTFCFSALLNAGFFKLLSSFVGNTSNVDKKSMVSHMKKEKDIALIPGGFEEASFTEFGKERVCLKDRAGFVKLALQYGYSITPVYGFKECFSYYNVPGFKELRKKLNKHSIPGIICFGNPFLPVLPKRETEIHVVVGKSVQLPKIENPTREEVSKYHQIYVQEVQNLFNRHKNRFYGEEYKEQLEVI